MLKCQKGAYIAELAIILPLITFLTAGGMILSLTIWSKVVVTDAAREGARYVALNYNPYDATSKVEEVISDGKLNKDNIKKVTTTKDTNYVTVKVEYNQPAIIPKLPELLGMTSWDNNFNIESTQVFKLEKP